MGKQQPHLSFTACSKLCRCSRHAQPIGWYGHSSLYSSHACAYCTPACHTSRTFLHPGCGCIRAIMRSHKGSGGLNSCCFRPFFGPLCCRYLVGSGRRTCFSLCPRITQRSRDWRVDTRSKQRSSADRQLLHTLPHATRVHFQRRCHHQLSLK